MKKFFTIIGVLVSIMLVAIVVIPLVVDVDQYRPRALKAVNEKLNGKLDLGHLKLSLWGAIRVEDDL